MSGGRIALVALAGAAGFAVGFYAGVFLVLSLVGFSEFEAWQFELSTLPLAGLISGVGIAIASPETGRIWVRVLAAALVAAVAMILLVRRMNGDFGLAFGLGLPLVTGTGTAVASVSVPN